MQAPARACAAHHDRLAVIAEAVKDLDLGPAKGHGGARRPGAPGGASATTASHHELAPKALRAEERNPVELKPLEENQGKF